MEKRLDLLNGIIGADFADKVTMEQLNSEQRISIGLHPEVRHELEERQRQEQELFIQQETRCGRNTYRAVSVQPWTVVTCNYSAKAKAGIVRRNMAGK